MGETERRRRRLRPSTGPTPTEPAPAETVEAETVEVQVVEAESAGTGVTTSAVDDPPVRPTPGGVPAPPVARPVAQADPRATRPPAGGNGRPAPGSRPTSGAGAGGADRESERGLRGLVGSGSSQVSVGAALRARDAARPTEEHLAEADANLTIVRRNWLPREDLPRNR